MKNGRRLYVDIYQISDDECEDESEYEESPATPVTNFVERPTTPVLTFYESPTTPISVRHTHPSIKDERYVKAQQRRRLSPYGPYCSSDQLNAEDESSVDSS